MRFNGSVLLYLKSLPGVALFVPCKDRPVPGLFLQGSGVGVFTEVFPESHHGSNRLGDFMVGTLGMPGFPTVPEMLPSPSQTGQGSGLFVSGLTLLRVPRQCLH